MHVEIEKPRLNPVHFAAIIAGALVNAFLVGGAYVSNNRDIGGLRDQIQQESSDRKDQQKGFQDTLSNVQKDISQIQPLTFQTTRAIEASAENKKATEEGLKNVNDRMDRVVESFGSKLDNVIDTINKVSTQVQVLSSKLDDMQGKSERTTFRMPIVRP